MLISAPFVVSPAFKMLWKLIKEGTLGEIHSARGLHGSAGYSWASWYHEEDALGIFAEQAPYNLKSFTTLLGPVTDVVSSIDRTILAPRTVAGKRIERPATDVSFATVRHLGGAVTSLVASSVIHRYRRRPLELYGTEGTVNLVGEVWRPEGVEIWESKKGYWRDLDARDDRWSWCDGLRNAIYALRNEETLVASIDQDLHILEVVEAARRSAIEQRPISVDSRFSLKELGPPDCIVIDDH
jgi:predicted dehydrogenase